MTTATVGLLTGFSLILGAARGAYLQDATMVLGAALIVPSIIWMAGMELRRRMLLSPKRVMQTALSTAGVLFVAYLPNQVTTYSQCLRDLKDDNERVALAADELLRRRIALHEFYTRFARSDRVANNGDWAADGGSKAAYFYIDPINNYQYKRFKGVDTPEIIYVITQTIRDWARGEVFDCDSQYDLWGKKELVIDPRCEKWSNIIFNEFAIDTFGHPTIRPSLRKASGLTRRWLHEFGDQFDVNLMKEFVVQYIPMSFLCHREHILLAGQKSSMPCDDVKVETLDHHHKQLVDYAATTGLIRNECFSRSLRAMFPKPIGKPYKE